MSYQGSLARCHSLGCRLLLALCSGKWLEKTHYRADWSRFKLTPLSTMGTLISLCFPSSLPLALSWMPILHFELTLQDLQLLMGLLPTSLTKWSSWKRLFTMSPPASTCLQWRGTALVPTGKSACALDGIPSHLQGNWNPAVVHVYPTSSVFLSIVLFSVAPKPVVIDPIII